MCIADKKDKLIDIFWACCIIVAFEKFAGRLI
jgi:hypothetical protein